jgi:hypothetical protein
MPKNMRRLFTLLLLLSTFQLFAADGDTTFVQSHQETHWDWNGTWWDTTAFPESGEYQRILMYYTLGCPSQGCSEWDYTTRIEVEDESESRFVELVRIITPYAGDKDDDWKHTWVIDVTDYAPLLKGEKRIRAHYGGWQDGFTVTIDFAFIEGTPPREVLEVNTLYDGTFKYGFSNDPIESHLVPTDIQMHADMQTSMVRMVASGHSFGGNENCAEFCKKWYKLYVDGTQAVQQDVWRDDCGSNPLEGQTGTWIYNRAGWCPGDVTERYDTDVSHLVSAGQTEEFNVDWQSYNYTGGAGFDPQYIIETQIFQYGAWNFENDLAISDVIRPSKKDRYVEMNPICNNPEIMITNTGAEIVTQAIIEYSVEGSPDIIRHEWKGVLQPGMSEQVVLPSYDKWLFGGKTDNVFHVEIKETNRGEDEYAGNNHFKSRFQNTMVLPEDFIIALNNNAGGSEISYAVIDERGNVLFERTGPAANFQYLDTVSLDTGCYTLLVEDSDCDGLSFFANSDGNGRIWLHSTIENEFFPPLLQLNREFGCEARLSFTVGYELGEPETMDYPEGVNDLYGKEQLRAYPNPSNGLVVLALEGMQQSGATIEILNQHGQLVQMHTLGSVNGVEVSNLPSGTYIARYQSDQDVQTVKFVIIR